MGTPVEKFGYWLLQLALDHQEAVGILVVGYIVASAGVSGLNAVYPDFNGRPRWARFVIGALEPWVVNIWRTVMLIFGKVGLKLKPLRLDSGDEIPAAAVRAAEKREQ